MEGCELPLSAEPDIDTLLGEMEAARLAEIKAGLGGPHNPRLSACDALHVAVMRRHEVTQIVSFDRDFDGVSGITRLPAKP